MDHYINICKKLHSTALPPGCKRLIQLLVVSMLLIDVLCFIAQNCYLTTVSLFVLRHLIGWYWSCDVVCRRSSWSKQCRRCCASVMKSRFSFSRPSTGSHRGSQCDQNWDMDRSHMSFPRLTDIMWYVWTTSSYHLVHIITMFKLAAWCYQTAILVLWMMLYTMWLSTIYID